MNHFMTHGKLLYCIVSTKIYLIFCMIPNVLGYFCDFLIIAFILVYALLCLILSMHYNRYGYANDD